MTPAEFFLAIRGFNDAIWKRWEHTRVIAYTTYATAPRKKNKRVPGMKSWMPLPQDKKVSSLTEVSKMDAAFNLLREKGIIGPAISKN